MLATMYDPDRPRRPGGRIPAFELALPVAALLDEHGTTIARSTVARPRPRPALRRRSIFAPVPRWHDERVLGVHQGGLDRHAPLSLRKKMERGDD